MNRIDVEIADDIAPIFMEFGAAIHAAQVLEHGLGLLQTLIAVNQDVSFPTAPDKAFRGGNETKTLGAIFIAVKGKGYFTPAEEKEIWGAFRLRNTLVHSFLVQRSLQLSKPSGRAKVMPEIAEPRDAIRKAAEVVDFLIDKYLAEYNTCVEDAKAAAGEIWVSGHIGKDDQIH